MKNKAVVLLSGGIDSVTTLFYAKQYFDIYTLSFDYGQKHKIELKYSRIQSKKANAIEHFIIKIPNNIFQNTALVNEEIKVPENRVIDNEIPLTYVPGRNLLFLSYAVSLAESRQIKNIFIGANVVDYSGYPDCRPEFIRSFEKTANLGTRIGVTGDKIKIHSPLIKKRKSEIIKMGLKLGVNYRYTSSCYQPTKEGNPCTKCDSCQIRIKAFEELNIKDPLL